VKKPMRPLLVVLLLNPVLLAAQSTTPTPKAKPVSPFAEYAGQWTSDFQGHVWLTLQLNLQGDQLQGWMVHPRSVDFTETGELKSISEEQSTEIVTDAVVNPDGLLLTLKDRDTQESDRYAMKLIQPAKDSAELRIVGMAMPPGMPKPKPWRLVRSGTTSSTAQAPR
jgi:hypothetical protein